MWPQKLLFLVPPLIWIACQGVKYLVGRWKGDRSGIFSSGGFPSSHAAFVASLATLVGRTSGLSSSAFAISFTLACLVFYDALTTRRRLGILSRELNRLQKNRRLEENVGHTGWEVAAGILFGVFVTLSIV